MIIGITGPYGSGKDTAADYLVSLGYTKFSLSDILRSEAQARGILPDREALIRIGNELRTRFGPGVLAARAKETFGPGNYVVPSIRNPSEIHELRRNPSFFLIALDAPSRTRYERHVQQERADKIASYDVFLASEKREQSSDASAQQVHLCMQLADVHVMNDCEKTAFHAKLDKVIADRMHGTLKKTY